MACGACTRAYVTLTAIQLYVCCMKKIDKIDKGQALTWRSGAKLKAGLEAAASD